MTNFTSDISRAREGHWPLGRRGGGLLRASLVAMALLFAVQFEARAQTPYQLKAAVLGNLAKFVDWPQASFSSPTDAIRIGILGEDPFGPDLSTILEPIKVRGRSFVLERSDKVEKLRDCHIIFISEKQADRAAEITAALQSLPILLVGEDARFLENGGVINFQMEERKVRFAIDLAAAERRRLSIHPQLLRLATSVIGKEGPK